MTTIPLPAQRSAPAATAAVGAPDAGPATVERGWAELLRTSAARGGLAMVACMLLWSILPALLGWSPRVILSGSMEPRVSVGDVIITREVPASTLAKGQVVTVKDPDHPDRTRTHRLVGLEADGSLLIKGDANDAADSSRISVDDVLGVGVIRVPWVGRPARWAAEGNWTAWALTALVLGGLVLSAFPSRRKPVHPMGAGDDDPGPDGAGPDGVGPDGAGPDGAGPDGAGPDGAGPDGAGVSTNSGPDGHSATGHACGAGDGEVPSRRRSYMVVVVAVAVAVVVAGAVSSPASAAFLRVVTNASNAWNAANAFYPYRAAVLADTPHLYWRLGQASGTAVADTGPGARPGTLVGSPYAWGQAGALAADALNTSLSLTTARINANTSVTAPATFSVEAWIKTTSTAGGRILGMGDATGTTNSTTIDRQLYLATTGKVMFGIGSSKITVASTAALNDGAWHHVVGTYATGTNGMKLYVDGTLQGSATATTLAFTGYWRAGAELMSGWSGNPTSTYFAGNLQELAVYTSALTATRVSAHRNAGITP